MPFVITPQNESRPPDQITYPIQKPQKKIDTRLDPLNSFSPQTRPLKLILSPEQTL